MSQVSLGVKEVELNTAEHKGLTPEQIAENLSEVTKRLGEKSTDPDHPHDGRHETYSIE